MKNVRNLRKRRFFKGFSRNLWKTRENTSVLEKACKNLCFLKFSANFTKTYRFSWKSMEIRLSHPTGESNWFLYNFNWKWKEIGLGQPMMESKWLLFKFRLKIKEFFWGSQWRNLIDFYLHFNWKSKQIDLGQSRTESNLFLFKFQIKTQMKFNQILSWSQDVFFEKIILDRDKRIV